MTDQEKAAYEFYRGEQWDAEQRAKREAAGRPCVTVNHMARVVDGEAVKRGLIPGTPEWREMVVAKVREFGDSQRIMNLYASNLAEEVGVMGEIILQPDVK